MSMEAIRNNRGAVSVFLILVLVPCIAVSCIFVDLGRVHLSKSSAEASADLALNTLLTNYDADLSEYYGLIGSCQNIKDFYTVSAEYFLRTIQSQGLSDDEILLLSGVYRNATGDDTIYDLLQVEPQTEASGMIKPVDNANLGNPAMLKDSVVEFMKYRAPIELATTLIGRLKDSAGAISQLRESKENDKLVKEKEEFYEAEGKLMQAAIYSYLAIEKYVDKVSNPKIDNAQMQADADQIDSYRDVYAKIHEYAVNYLLNTGSLTKNYSRVVYDINKFNTANIKDLPDIYSSTGTAADGSTTVYYLNGNDLDTQIQAASDAITNLETATNQYKLAAQDLMPKWHPATNGYNPVQWWVDMDNAIFRGPYGNVHREVSQKGEAVMNAYKHIKAMMDGCEAEPKPQNAGQNYKELPADWKTTCQNKLNDLEAAYNKYLSSSPTDWNQPYIKAAVALATICAEHTPTVKASSHSVTVDGTSLTVDSAVIYIAAQLTSMRSKYDTIIKKLDTAINGDGDKTPSMDDLLKLAKTYGTEFNGYNTAAQSSGTEMGKDEREHIKLMELQKEITDASVTQLKTRLENIRDQFITLRSKIDALTYGGTALKDIQSFSAFKSAAKTVVTDANTPLSQTALDNYVKTTFDQLFKPAEGSEIDLEHTDDDNYNPNLKVNAPTLYKYMVDEFGKMTEQDLKEEAEDETGAKNAQETYEKELMEAVTAYRGDKTHKMPGTYSDTGVFGVTDMFGSVIDLILDLFDGNFTNIRDDLYVTTYAMEMFSYATFDRQAMYQNMDEAARKAMTPSATNLKDFKYFKDNNVYGDPAGNLKEQKNMWVSIDLEDTFNKSLTNKMINLDNNYQYLAEVEYLLYGQADPVENLKKAYGDIYTIRFTLNTISAFHHFWPSTGTNTGAFLEGVSVAISGLFAGVVPAPVIKAVLMPILAAMESCKDNQRLFAGMPVEIYKMDESEWWFALDGSTKGFSYTKFFDLLKRSADLDEDKNQDKGIFYSDYMTLFVYCGFTHNESAMYKRLGKLIEKNMEQLTDAESFSLSNTQMYFELNAKLRVKPLMVTIPYYLDEYDNPMKTATDWCTYNISVTRGYS